MAGMEEVAVPSPAEPGALRAPYWPYPLLRALPALVLALVITFTPAHTADMGMLSFGIFALVTGVVLVAFAARGLRDGILRSFFAGQALLSLAAGVVALLLQGGGASFFVFLVSAWAALSGFLELYCGLRSRGRLAAWTDWVGAGVMTILLAVALLLVPADYRQPWQVAGEDGAPGASGVLTSEIVGVGIFGAYAAVIGVYLIIGGVGAWLDARPRRRALEAHH